MVNCVEAMLFYCPVERDVLGGQPCPWDHIFLREFLLVQLFFAFYAQNAVNERERVAVAVVVVFIIPFGRRMQRRKAKLCVCMHAFIYLRDGPARWCTPAIPATWEAATGGSEI